jgi:hypothetical protein
MGLTVTPLATHQAAQPTPRAPATAQLPKIRSLG